MATSSPRNSIGNVRSDMDISYPEHLSRLNRHLVVEVSKSHNRIKRTNRPRTRYRTQPVTFDEIQEVDEENCSPDIQNLEEPSVSASLSTSKLNLESCIYPSVLGTRRKKSKALDNEKTTGDKAKFLLSNGDSIIQQTSIEELRRIDRDRETSI